MQSQVSKPNIYHTKSFSLLILQHVVDLMVPYDMLTIFLLYFTNLLKYLRKVEPFFRVDPN